jgi:drug/metabolite transporter (DMT)-like permease
MMSQAIPKNKSLESIKVSFALLVTMFLWASAFVGIRYAGPYFNPGALALGRLISGFLVLLVVSVFLKSSLPPRKAYRGLALAGIFWFGVYMVALNWSEHYIDAATAALVMGIGPIFAVMIATLVLREKLTIQLVLGLAIAATGTVIASHNADVANGSLWGILLCVVAALGFAIGSTGQKPALAFVSPLQATTAGCFIGAIVCLPFLPQLIADAGTAPPEALVIVVLLGALPTALAFFTWAYAMSRAPAGILAASTYIVPLFTLVLGWLFLSELPDAWAAAGGALCLLGVVVLRSKRSWFARSA